jgi:hypothetical protein
MIAAFSHFSGRFFGFRTRRIIRRAANRASASAARRIADEVDEMPNMYAAASRN